MLRRMKKTLTVLLAAFTLSVVAACGGGSTVAGTYQLDGAAAVQSMKEMVKDMPPAVAEMMPKEMTGSLELKSDGSVVIDQTAGGKPNKMTGTWKADGDKITVTAKDAAGKETTLPGTLVGGVITLGMPEMMPGKKMELVFRRK